MLTLHLHRIYIHSSLLPQRPIRLTPLASTGGCQQTNFTSAFKDVIKLRVQERELTQQRKMRVGRLDYGHNSRGLCPGDRLPVLYLWKVRLVELGVGVNPGRRSPQLGRGEDVIRIFDRLSPE